MEKETQYFTHDFNARNEDKILCMRRIFKMDGYGMFWAIVEMLNESDEKKLSLKRLDAVAMQLQCRLEKVQRFVDVCSKDPINLFVKNGEYFFSDSVLRRADKRMELKQKRVQAAEKRWGKDKQNMQEHSKVDASGMQSNAGAKQNDAKKLNKLNKDTVGISLFNFIKDYEELSLDEQIEKLCKLWEIKRFSFSDTEKLISLIKSYGLKDVWFAFTKSFEMNKVKKNVLNLSYVGGILKRKNKARNNSNNQKGTS